ncbi:MAG TPA: enoyl-CoA hydratase/isomerase family protein [Sedimenticola thiotaurini]|uniref:Enoyl-CoA hydratase/isomerase family protein n=1 Tax=Sedimenticola thiotaurini TaxID=1543721 RepID=A0A831W847_9GAMM|nr:enoyl-CoA hydratase/isomerase family protein [Sedimenticola thiotaurini]
MTERPVVLQIDARGVARITLNRPRLHNAFDDVVIARLSGLLDELAERDGLRALVLAAEGRSFSAGADLNWMRRMADYSPQENRADADRLAGLMRRLDRLPVPTIARVQGAAFGGGVGLIACCDMAIASERARFALSEVRLGIMPAVISPYVIAAIGPRAARRWILSGERFDAAEALRIGLLHQVVAEESLDEAVEALLTELLACGPRAQAAAKRLIRDVACRPIDQALIDDTAARITELRASPEGREGLSAFLEKRPPAWVLDET